MHAAIIADTMRVNWIPVVASHEISTFKWLDWLSTSDVEYNPIYIGLPDLGNEKLNRLKINYGVCAYKPAYQGLNALNLLKIKSARKLSFLQKRLFRLNLSIINHSRVSLSAQEEYQDNFVNKLIEVKNSSTYLSSDECFYRNLNLIKNKMDELLSFLKCKH